MGQIKTFKQNETPISHARARWNPATSRAGPFKKFKQTLSLPVHRFLFLSIAGPSRRLAAGAPPPSPYQTRPHLLILTRTNHAAVAAAAAAGEPFVLLYPPRTPAGAAASAPSRGVSGLALHLTSRGPALGMVGRFPVDWRYI